MKLLLTEGTVNAVHAVLESKGSLVRGKAVCQSRYGILFKGEADLQLFFHPVHQVFQLPPGDLLQRFPCKGFGLALVVQGC